MSDGNVYVASSNNRGDTWLYDLSRDGVLRFRTGFDSQWEQYWSPLVIGGSVFLDGGTGGGLYGFDATNGGSRLFFNGDLSQFDRWSPAWWGGSVWTLVGGVLRQHDPTKGSTLAAVALPSSAGSYSMETAPVAGSCYLYVVSRPDLVAVDPVAMEAAWSVSGTFGQRLTALPAAASIHCMGAT